MIIESKDLKAILYKLKQDTKTNLDKSMNKKVQALLDVRISVIEDLLIWINQSESKEVLNVETLKLGELTRWEPTSRRGGVDDMIIEASKSLKRNYDAIKVSVETVKWTTLSNRTYKLRETEKISSNIVPRKNKDGVFLVYLDKPNPRRARS